MKGFVHVQSFRRKGEQILCSAVFSHPGTVVYFRVGASKRKEGEKRREKDTIATATTIPSSTSTGAVLRRRLKEKEEGRGERAEIKETL